MNEYREDKPEPDSVEDNREPPLLELFIFSVIIMAVIVGFCLLLADIFFGT